MEQVTHIADRERAQRSAEIVDLAEFRELRDEADFAVPVRDRTLRRIRLLRRLLDEIEPRVAAVDVRGGVRPGLDAADVGTEGFIETAGRWFGWAFDPPPPPPLERQGEVYRQWVKRIATGRIGMARCGPFVSLGVAVRHGGRAGWVALGMAPALRGGGGVVLRQPRCRLFFWGIRPSESRFHRVHCRLMGFRGGSAGDRGCADAR